MNSHPAEATKSTSLQEPVKWKILNKMDFVPKILIAFNYFKMFFQKSTPLSLSLSLFAFFCFYLGVDAIKLPLSSNSITRMIFVLWPRCLELLYEGQQGEPVRKLVLYVTLRKVELGLICKQGHNVNTLFQLQALDLITFEHNCDYDCCIAWTPKFSSWALKARSC